MRTDRAFPMVLASICLSISTAAPGLTGQTADTTTILASQTLSPEGRKAIQDRIDAVHELFRATHGGLGPEQFGAQCCQITQIPAAGFTPLDGGLWTAGTSGYIYPPTLGANTVWAPVPLPSGVSISYVDLYYYDADNNYDVAAHLVAYPGGGFDSGAPSETLLRSAASTDNLGYGYASSPPFFSYTVNNDVGYDPAAAQLVIQVAVFTTSDTANVGFKAVDLWWMRQVSPAPATATFTDVPASDPAFQFIEALVASGITVGCSESPPLYCPDNALTRRQMAVFLSKALGLYWPH